MAVELVHWNPSRPVVKGRIGRLFPGRKPVNNFGDLLGPILVQQILRERGISADTATSARLLSVGSIMHLSASNDVVWGTGVNGKSLAIGAAPNLDVRAVRGPLTRAELLAVGTAVPEVFGDPALLWARYWPRESYCNDSESRSAVSIVPNFHDWPQHRTDPRAINPCERLETVMHRIAASDFVVGSSLHGIVVSESFGIPARAVASSTEPEFKYADYYLGTGRLNFSIASSVDNAISLGGEDLPQWNPDQLLDAFPEDLWIRND